MSNKWLLGAVFVAAGCGSAELPGATPLDCSGAVEARRLRIDAVDLSTEWTGTGPPGVDFDSDGIADNQAGAIFGALTALFRDFEGALPARFERRLETDTIWLIDVEQCDGQSRVSLVRGELDGAVVRVIDDGEVPAAGTSIDGRVEADQGIGTVPLGALADYGDSGVVIWHTMDRTRFELDLAPDEASGRIDGVLASGHAEVFVMALVPTVQAHLDAGDLAWATQVDTNEDGVITIGELESDGLIQFILNPDVGDGMSFGFRVHAVDVEIE